MAASAWRIWGRTMSRRSMWNETMQQDDGTISRRPAATTGFPDCARRLGVERPTFLCWLTRCTKTPTQVCNTHRAYDVLDLETLPDDYLPRTNYRPMADRAEYLRRTPRVSWMEEGETSAAASDRLLSLCSSPAISSVLGENADLRDRPARHGAHSYDTVADILSIV